MQFCTFTLARKFARDVYNAKILLFKGLMVFDLKKEKKQAT